MGTWTRFALGAGLAGALFLGAPDAASAGTPIGAATGEFEVSSATTRPAEVAWGEAPFEVDDEPLVGDGRAGKSTSPVPPRGGAATAAANEGKPSKEEKGKEPSPAARSAEPSYAPSGGTCKQKGAVR